MGVERFPRCNTGSSATFCLCAHELVLQMLYVVRELRNSLRVAFRRFLIGKQKLCFDLAGGSHDFSNVSAFVETPLVRKNLRGLFLSR